MADVFGKTLMFGQNPTGKVTIYHAVTGEAIERWPVDARGMVAHGEYTLTPPASTEGASEVAAESVPEPQGTPVGTVRLHPLSTGDVAVPIVLGEAAEARPVEIPAPGVKRGPGRPRKFPKE